MFSIVVQTSRLMYLRHMDHGLIYLSIGISTIPAERPSYVPSKVSADLHKTTIKTELEE